jgi:hypothetical protein
MLHSFSVNTTILLGFLFESENFYSPLKLFVKILEPQIHI